MRTGYAVLVHVLEWETFNQRDADGYEREIPVLATTGETEVGRFPSRRAACVWVTTHHELLTKHGGRYRIVPVAITLT